MAKLPALKALRTYLKDPNLVLTQYGTDASKLGKDLITLDRYERRAWSRRRRAFARFADASGSSLAPAL